MKKFSVRSLVIGALAFAAGAVTMHLAQPAAAAAPPLTAAAIDLSTLQPSRSSAAGPGFTERCRSRKLEVADGATAAVQIGTVIKHFHADANEIQVVIAAAAPNGSAPVKSRCKPGMVLIIPMGTAHGGTTDPNLKIFSFKTPPQAPTDVHPVP